MSLQGLISGAECAAPANPLSQVLKHTEGDRSVQQDRVAGPSSSRLHHLPGTPSHAIAQPDAALAQHFFQGSSSPHGFHFTHKAPLQLLNADAQRIQHQASRPVDLSGAWPAAQVQQVVQRAPATAQWAADFEGAQGYGMSKSAVMTQNNAIGSSYMPAHSFSTMPLGMRSIGSPFLGMPASSYDGGKGKGKATSIPADFDAAFAEAAASLFATQSGSARIAEVDDVAEIEAGLQAATLHDQTESTLVSGDNVDPAMVDWESDFHNMMDSYREDGEYDYGQAMREAYENGVGEFGNTLDDKALQYDDEGVPILGDYAFETNNQYLSTSMSSRSLLDEAKALLDASGSLSEVALILEAAIQKGELGEGGYESWLLLGETRSMDEREDSALVALAEGVKRATASGASGAGMLSLAIAYTNESYERASYTTLLRWLQAKYPSLSIPAETLNSVSASTWHSNPLITEAFLGLARSQHASDVVDADVQVALGVLFYAKGDYEHAGDCFQSALAVRPTDFRLWNRYGSCLSNGNKPEESLGAYQEALRLRPTYTRAVYNVAVACMNIGAHREAVEHLLGALASQESAGKESSEQLWTTLRRAFSIMDRPDLADLAKSRPDLINFRKEFDFATGSPHQRPSASTQRDLNLEKDSGEWFSPSDVTA